jgi:hypothetical protein
MKQSLQKTSTICTPRRPTKLARLLRVAQLRPERVAALSVLASAAILLSVALAPALLGNVALIESQVLEAYAPWRDVTHHVGVRGVTPAHDTLDFYLPFRAEAVERLREGDLPLWEPYAGGGTPLTAVTHIGFWSPFNLPYLLLPLWLAPAYSRLLVIVVAASFTYLLLRHWKVARASSGLGGLVYATSGFLSLWFNWPQSQVAALIPALFWASLRFGDKPRVGRGLLVSLFVCWMAIEGFPAVLGYAGMALAVFFAAQAGERRSLRSKAKVWAAWLGFCLLGFALAAFQLLPLSLHLAAFELGYRQQTPEAHLPFAALLTTLLPWVYGAEVFGNFSAGGNTIELVSFVGAAAVVLAFFVLQWPRAAETRSRLMGPIAAVLVASVVLAWVGGPPLALAQNFPLFGDSSIGRLRSLFCFLLALLAALGFNRMLREGGNRPRADVRNRRSLVSLLAVLVFTLTLGVAVLQSQETLRWDAAAVPHIMSGAVAIAVLVMSRRRAIYTVGLAAVPILIAMESLLFTSVAWPSAPAQNPYPATKTTDFLERNLGHDRFASPNGVMFPSANAAYGLRSATGHAFQATEWRDLLAAADPSVPRPPTLSMLGRSWAAARSPVLDRIAAKYWVADPAYGVFGEPVAGPVLAVGDTVLQSGDSIALDVPLASARGAILRAIAPFAPASAAAPLELVLQATDSRGRLVGQGVRRSAVPLPAGDFWIPFATEVDGLDAVDVTLQVSGGSVSLAIGADGRPLARPIVHQYDGLALRLADDSLVYERLEALPRIRWASTARVEGDPDVALGSVAALAPTETLLHSGEPGGQGKPASIDVLEDSGDSIRISVSSAGDGYVVVADAMQTGWTAIVDGRHQKLIPAEHGLVALPMTAGLHHAELRYSPPGLRLGLLVSAMAAGIGLAGIGVSLLCNFRRRTSAESRYGRSSLVQALTSVASGNPPERSQHRASGTQDG